MYAAIWIGNRRHSGNRARVRRDLDVCQYHAVSGSTGLAFPHNWTFQKGALGLGPHDGVIVSGQHIGRRCSDESAVMHNIRGDGD